MSDRKPNDTEFDDKTAIRQQPNDDETVARGKTEEVPAERAAPERDEAEPADETIIREPKESSAPAASDDATIIKEPAQQPPGDAEPDPGGNATILRGSGSETGNPASGNATILRGAGGAATSDNATILRDGRSNEHATILRGGSADSEDSTVLKDGGVAGDGDSTVMRGGDEDDRTLINDDGGDDSTVIGASGRGVDTTYVASAGKAEKSKGNSEAGRLLKNRFVLEEKVGSGGMGDVYKALDLRQQEAQERNPYIAIKILNDDFARHKDAFISLQREATRTRGIPHPNIMAVYDFDREGETVFMSMELLDGKPLDDYLRDHPEGVSVEDAWNIIDGICQGLSRAHGAGIVHSDFKPGNIYYTEDKLAKVFDFGIARAVTSPGDIKADGEKTVFDAGSLGALTPTYASYEMLVGEEPTKSDDVYAVALVAYELFTGRHPYNRTPADKALERGLEPEPVPFLKRRHWRALKKGLALKGEDRYQSIDEFYTDIFSEDPPYFRYAAVAAVLVASIGFGVYTMMFGGEEIPPEYTALQGRLQADKNDLSNRLGNLGQPITSSRGNWNFQSQEWREGIRTNLNRARAVDLELREQFADYYGEETDPEIQRWRERALQVYLEAIRDVRAGADVKAEDAVDIPADIDELEEMRLERSRAEMVVAELDRAQALLSEVRQFLNFDATAIANAESQLGVDLALATDDLQDIGDDIETEEARLVAVEEARLAEEARLLAESQRNETYLALLDEFRDILRCKGDIPTPPPGESGEDKLALLGVVLNGPGQIETSSHGVLNHTGLRGTFPVQFEVDKPGIVQALQGCITNRIAVRAPERARTVKSRVMGYLPESAEIANILIEDLDPCAQRNLEGRGNRNGSWCADKLSVGDEGPELVVVPPPPGNTERLAISRIEIKRSDYNRYCQDVGCAQLEGPGSLPVTNISLDQARAYTVWLSDQTGRQYRLPTAEEWLYAARTNLEEPIDDNINCTVDARGVRLGDTLLSTLSGRPNRWGLYNYVGNAREWAVSGDAVMAMGGAHTDPKSECTLDKQVAHTGQADPVTGFRIVRVVES